MSVKSGPGGALEFGEPDGSDSRRLAALLALFDVGEMADSDRPIDGFSVSSRSVIREAVWYDYPRNPSQNFQLVDLES